MTYIQKAFSLIIVLFFAIGLVACNKAEDQDLGCIFDHIIVPEEVSMNITLPTRVEGFPYIIHWTSNNTNYLRGSGVVFRPHNCTDVVLTATVHMTGGTERREFNVRVAGHDFVGFTADRFISPFGFAALGMNRVHNAFRAGSERLVSGIWTTVEDRDGVAIVDNEVDFLRAFANTSISVIEITEDLNMGWHYVNRMLNQRTDIPQDERNRMTNSNVFRQNANLPFEHPTLVEYGVSQLRITGRHGLMIFSRHGAKISYMTTRITESSDIVFRNLHLTGIWEWDDDMRGAYDANDWDYFTIEYTQGLWLDHITMDQAFDGILDARMGNENITMSYVKMNFQVNQHLIDQFDYLEQTLIVEGVPGKTVDTSRYMFLRQFFSQETIMEYAATQMKGLNLGNTDGGLGFETLAITMHHIYIRNLRDRVPRIRQGDAHLFNIYHNQADIARLRSQMAPHQNITSQGIVTTELGAVFMQNSMFVHVNQPIRNHQDSNLAQRFTGRFKVENSVIRNHDQDFLGGCQDFGSPWRRSNTNIFWNLDFFFRNHQTIPYRFDHLLIDPYEVRNSLIENGVGAGVRENFSWLRFDERLSINNEVNTRDYHMMDRNNLEMPDILFDMHAIETGIIPSMGLNGSTGEPMGFPHTQTIRNFYFRNNHIINMVEGRDYERTVDTSDVNWTRPGVYTVIYTYQSLINDWDRFILRQTVRIFDSQGTNDVFFLEATPEYDGQITVDANVFVPFGRLYWVLSETPTLDANYLIANGNVHDLITSATTFENIVVGNNRFFHILSIYTPADGEERISAIATVAIVREEIVQISTAVEFDLMLQAGPGSRGVRFYLMNDIDFTNFSFAPLRSDQRFHGVFEGNGHTLKNITSENAHGGIWSVIDGGTLRNFVVDNANITVRSVWHRPDPEEQPDFFQQLNPGDDAGIIARQVQNWASLDNITVKNSHLDSHTNYAAVFIGRVRSGDAYFNNLSVLNTTIFLDGVTSAYSAGFVGAGQPNTRLTMTNLFADGLHLEHEQADMIGVVVGRVRGWTYIRNVVLLNTTIYGRHNLGIISGKEETTVDFPIGTFVYNVFADVEIILQPFVGDPNRFSNFYGYVFGNYDSDRVLVENMFAFEIAGPNINFGTGGGTSSGWNRLPDGHILDRDMILDLAWFEANLPEILANSYWTFADNRPVLLNAITD